MTTFQNNLKVALSDDFLGCFSRIPKAQQKKVMKFVAGFRANPAAPGYNYEKIHGASDPNMRSVRIDQAWRAVVLRPKQDNVYVLLWIDHHDNAYKWATTRRCVVHPDTGSLQILPVEPMAPPSVALPPEPAAAPELVPEPVKPLFASFESADLQSVGVPASMLEIVQGLEAIEQLDLLQAQLPQEAYEALYFLAAGDTLEQVRRELDLNRPPKTIDPEDFEAALDNPTSRQRFVVVEDELELQAIMDAPLERWRVFLHPSQRRLVENHWRGPVRVLGGAGTGKTVVLIHRAAHLARNVFTAPHDRILLTTFTTNLAADIRDNLRKVCPADALKRIEVTSLDSWVHGFLKRQGYAKTIKYFGGRDEVLRNLWAEALEKRSDDQNLPTTFFREEWEDVIQVYGCLTERDYLKARRAGRGVRLSRSQRRAIWPVFEEYRHLMADHDVCEDIDAMRDARQIMAHKGNMLPYRAVLVDEAQDMSLEAFRLLRQIVPPAEEGRRPNDLFIVGDGHQKIYRRKVVMSHAGVDIIGRSHRLKINYRTTDEIRDFAVRLLEGQPIDDLDGGQDTLQGYKSLMHGDPPEVLIADTLAKEIDCILDFLDADSTELRRTCLVARTQSQLDLFARALDEQGIEIYRLRRSEAEAHNKPGLRVATMHRVKGLEFEKVIVAGARAGVIPLKAALDQTHDTSVRAQTEVRERALLYVALTRARRSAAITCHGTPSPFLA